MKEICYELVESNVGFKNDFLHNHTCEADFANFRAISSFKNHDLDETLKHLNEAIKHSASYHHHYHLYSSYIHNLCGYENLKEQKDELALKNFKEAIFQDHENSDAYYFLGLVYFILQDYDKADQYYDICLKKFPLDERPYYNLLKDLPSLLRKNPYENDLNFKKNVGLSPNQNIGLLTNLDDKIEKLYQCHDNYHQNFSYQYKNRAFIYYKLGLYEIALNDLYKALDLYSNCYETYIMMATIYYHNNNYHQYINFSNKAYEVKQKNIKYTTVNQC